MVLRPAVAVDIAFNAGYSTPAASRVWTDVTQYVRIIDGIDITHGRGDERGQADANTLRLTLKNSDGRFTPGLASSPYYPDVKIGRAVRVRTQLLANGTFETDVTGWTGSNATLARSTAQAHSGVASMSMTASTAATMLAVTSGSGTGGIPVSGSTLYPVEAWFRAATAARSCQVRVDWWDSAGVFISTSTGTSVSDSTSAWTKVSELYTSPSNAAYARFQALVISPAAGEVHYVDDAFFGSVRFTGYVDEWPLEWPAVVDTFATSTITATSRIARLGASAPLSNHIYEEFKRDSPAAHYMLDNLTDSIAGGVPLVQTGTGTAVTFEGTGPTDGIQAAQFVGQKYLAGTASIPASAVAIECFMSTTASPISESGFLTLTNSGGDFVKLVLDTAGAVRLIRNGTTLVISSASLNDGATRHFAATLDGTTATLYIDGVSAGSLASAGNDAYSTIEVGRDFACTLAHVAVAGSVSAARIAAHATAGLTGHATETAEARLQRYAAFAGIPTAEQFISTAADTPMAYIDTTGQTSLALMQKVDETDGGVLYDSRDGLLTYAARTARYTAAAAVTLDASAGQVGASYAPKLDRSSIINEVVATIANGSDPQETVSAKNATSYTDYGPFREDIELATTDANEAHAAAWWRVNTYGEPQARAPQLDVEIAHMSATLQASILALAPGSKITVTSLPSQSDAASKSFFVEGYNERIGPETHTFTFNISPTTGFDVWTVEDPVYGQYDAYPIAY